MRIQVGVRDKTESGSSLIADVTMRLRAQKT